MMHGMFDRKKWRRGWHRLARAAGTWCRIRAQGSRKQIRDVARGSRTEPRTHRAVFEALEPRLLLSADLLPVAPSPLVLETFTPADIASGSVIVEDLGDTAVTAPIRIVPYPSEGGSPDAADSPMGASALAASSLPSGDAAISQTLVDPEFSDVFLDTPFGALVQAMPERSWAKVNLNRFDSVWTPEQLQAQGGLGQPKSVIEAWSSMAWDSKRGDLIFWGGGHANYNGNEVYRWSASTLQWERASLPSQVELIQSPQYDTVDGAMSSPVSSHTYDNSEYLPIVDRFITFGGAAAHTGSIFLAENPDGTWRVTGPYLWDPSRADANLVGGVDGSGVNPATLGGQMWENRDNNQRGHTEGTTAYAEFGGKDGLFVEVDHGVLYRYILNDLDNPALDTYELIGGTNPFVFTGQGAGAYDPVHNVYVRTAARDSLGVARLVYWDIDLAAPTNWNRFATLNDPSGTFRLSWDLGLDYDPVRGTFVAWNGDGDLWAISVPSDLSSAWDVEPLYPGGPAAPAVASISGVFTGVLGKWKYLSGVDLFAGVIDPLSGDVWIYKPTQWAYSEANAPVSPTLASLAPTQAAAGAAVTLNGVNFGAQQGTGSVQFGSTAAAVDAWSDTQIVARAPAGLTGPVTVRVATPAGTSNGLAFLSLSSAQTRIGDDGAAGYSTSGKWTPFTGQGYLNDVQESVLGDAPSVATWQFSGLASGQYRVSATWSPYVNRATNAPYSINGGPAILVNQRLSPNDLVAEGASWEDLGVIDLAGSTLTVQLSNLPGVNGNVIADAIRIERIG